VQDLTTADITAAPGKGETFLLWFLNKGRPDVMQQSRT